MGSVVDWSQVYAPSSDVLTQDIDGELFVLPLSQRADSGMGGVFALNSTGRAVWEHLDGRKELRDVVQALSGQYQIPVGQIEADVRSLVAELLAEGILVTVPKDSAAI